MTEFEKWVNTRGQSKNEVDPYAYCFAEEAWKAALEWALSYYDKENKDLIEDYHFAESGAWFLIDKELKELNNE